MDPNPDFPPPDRAASLVRLCWQCERLRAAAAEAGASAAAGHLAAARDALLHDVMLDETALAGSSPAQILALLSLRRSAC